MWRHIPGSGYLAAVLPIVSMIFAGCSLQPPQARPALPVPERYAEAAETDTRAAAPDDWPRFFSDPRLQAQIALALEHNRQLHAAVARVEQARALYRIQGADLLPSLSAGASMTRGATPADLNATGTRVVGSEFRVGAVVPTWELDFWGRVRSLKDAALAQYLASAETRVAFELSLVGQVANTALSLRELDERIALAEKTLASREESYRIARRRHELGATSELDLRLSETLLATTRADLALLHQQQAQAGHALDLLIGTPPQALPAALPLAEQGIMLDLPPGLPSELLTQRPDLRASEQALRAARANIGAARAAFFPRIALTGGYGSASAELQGLFDSGSSAWSFAPSLTLPLFDGGRNRANLDLAKAREVEAVAGYEATVQRAFLEVSDALSNRRWLAAQRRALDELLEAQQVRVYLAQRRYDAGASPFLEVLDAERSLFSVQQAAIQTRRAELSNAVALYLALGGGLGPSAAASPSGDKGSDKE